VFNIGGWDLRRLLNNGVVVCERWECERHRSRRVLSSIHVRHHNGSIEGFYKVASGKSINPACKNNYSAWITGGVAPCVKSRGTGFAQSAIGGNPDLVEGSGIPHLLAG